MLPTPLTAGWYDDPDGRRRWWDGKRWGAYAPWDARSAPRVVRSSSSKLRLDRQYLLDPTEPGPRRTHTAARPPAKRMGIAYALLLILGPLGAHRTYVGRGGSAFLMFLLTAIGAALILVPPHAVPWLARLDELAPLRVLGAGALALLALWLLVDLFRTAGFVHAVNRRAQHASQPRTYNRGWPAA